MAKTISSRKTISSSRSSSGSGYRRSSGSSQISPLGVLIVFIIIVSIIATYALLQVPIHVVIALFVASVAGIVIIGAAGKPVLTPEDKLRESTINQFQIPNTKEALLEFSILATQKIKPVSPVSKIFTIDGKRQDWLNKVWTQKCNTIYTKARIAMKDDSSSLNEITRLMINAGIKV